MMRLVTFAILLAALARGEAGRAQTGFVVDTALLPPTNGSAPFQAIPFAEPFEPGVTPIVVVLPVDDCPDTVTTIRPPPGNPVTDCEPAHVRIRNVTSAGFEAVQIEPPDGPNRCVRWGGCDASHTATMFSYLAVAPGTFTLPDGTQVEAGRVSTTTSQDGISGGGSPPNGWVDVSFSVDLGGSPVLLATLQTLVNEQGLDGGGSYVTSSRPFLGVAIQNITGTGGASGFGGFRTAVELFEVSTGVGAGGLPSAESIGWIAFPNGVRSTLPDGNGNEVAWGTLATAENINGFEANNSPTPNQCYGNSLTGLPGSITSPIALAQKRTRNGPNGGWFRRCELAVIGGDTIRVGVAVDEDMDQDVERQHQGTEAASVVVFGGPLVTTPVSLARFDSERRDGALTIDWVVASEVSHAGYRVLGRAPGGGWIPLHEDLVPSRQIDQRGPEAYTITLPDRADVTELALEDHDVQGRTTRYGPFPVGEHHGATPHIVATDWKVARQTMRAPRPKRLVTAARLFVDRDGIQRVGHRELLAAGVDLTGLAVARLALLDEGRPVSRHVGGGRTWGVESFVEFVGTARRSLYGYENAYVLTVDPTRALAADSSTQPFEAGVRQAVTRTRIELAPARAYGFSSPLEDPWFDVELGDVGGRPRSVVRSFAVVAPASERAVVEASLWGVTDLPGVVDHRIQLRFNGAVVAEEAFDGGQPARLRVPVEVGAGSNEVVVELLDGPGTFSIVSLDGVALEYERPTRADAGGWAWLPASGPKASPEQIFRSSFEKPGTIEVRGFGSTEVVAWVADGRRRLLPEARLVRGAAGGGDEFAVTLPIAADELARAAEPEAILVPRVEPGVPAVAVPPSDVTYLIVGPAPLLAEATPIADRHRQAGRSVALVDVASIYAGYSDHVLDGEAIQAFIADSFGERFGYVLLLGDDTFDYRDDLGLGSVSFVPTRYAEFSKIITYGPTDALLGDTNGDRMPDVAVGRLPVRSVAELAAWIAKADAVASQSGAALFAADRRVVLTERIDEFSWQSQLLEQSFGGAVETAYHTDLGAAGVAAALRAAFDERRPLVNFAGHSSFDRLSFDRVLDVPTVQGLPPGALIGLLTAWGCWNSYFVQPDFDELGSALLRQPGAGAVNVIGASTLVDGDASLALAVYFFERLRAPAMTIGQALTEARARLARDRPGSIDALLGVTILGDPAAVLPADR